MVIKAWLERWGLLRAGRTKAVADSVRYGQADRAGLRVLFVANSLIPTLTLSFLRPLAPYFQDGQVAAELLTEGGLKTGAGRKLRARPVARWLGQRFASFRPQLVVFCRYSGPAVDAMLDLAQAQGAATLFMLDDDLLHVPPEFGADKYAFHNAPSRLATIRRLLQRCDLTVFSNAALKARFSDEAIGGRVRVAELFAASDVLRAPPPGTAALKIGYMGIDHAHDLALVVPVLVRLLARHPTLSFELFGPMPMPEPLRAFGARVRSIAAVRGYDAFLQTFVQLDWSIGICPLVDNAFNRVKSDLKWVEYTAVGAAVVASSGLMYDGVCADGCGLLAGNPAEWEQALEQLVQQPALRLDTVARAQARLRAERSTAALGAQLMQMFAQLRAQRDGGSGTRPAAMSS